MIKCIRNIFRHQIHAWDVDLVTVHGNKLHYHCKNKKCKEYLVVEKE